jgi:D-3-phosphoglycerate dehydrogenase
MKVLLIGRYLDSVTREVKKKARISRLERFDAKKSQGEIENADVIVINASTKVDRRFLEKAKSLKTLITFTHGYDHVDLDAVKARSINFHTVPGSTPSVVELTFGLMIAVLRKIPELDRRMKRGEWKKEFGRELFGKTLGVIGLGPIGANVCRIARSLGMNVAACDPNKLMKGEFKVSMVSLERLLEISDIVSLHAHLDEKTENMIGDRELKRMKRSAILINTARGGLVDSEALYRALKSGRIAGAGLDVFEKETPGKNKLLGLKNVVSTPHTGADTFEGEERKAEILIGILNNL